MKWDDKLLINIDEIDNQHKKLFFIAHDLHTELLAGRGNEVISNVLKSLVDYVIHHFATEEKLMKKYEYSGIDKHQAEHEAFVSKTKGYITKYQDKQPLLAREILIYLGDWYGVHILKTDKKFGNFLQNTDAVN